MHGSEFHLYSNSRVISIPRSAKSSSSLRQADEAVHCATDFREVGPAEMEDFTSGSTAG
jgi:hypothetical protein